MADENFDNEQLDDAGTSVDTVDDETVDDDVDYNADDDDTEEETNEEDEEEGDDDEYDLGELDTDDDDDGSDTDDDDEDGDDNGEVRDGGEEETPEEEVEEPDDKPPVEANQIFKKDFDSVKKLYPNIKAKSVKDFGKRFLDIMASNGNKLTAVEAWEVTHMDEVKAAAARKAADKAVAAERGKEKMKSVSSKGKAGIVVNVPKDILNMYHQINPNMTDAQIAKHYQKNK